MKTKKLNILFASLFALVFLMGFASATITLSPSVTTLSQTSGTFTVNVAGITTETINLVAVSGITFTPTYIPNSITANGVFTVNYVITGSYNFKEEYPIVLTANDGNSLTSDATTTLTFISSDFCESVKNEGKLKTSIEDIQVIGDNSFGEDSDWFLFDEIEVEVLVENNGDEDVNNVVLEWGLYNTQSKSWTIEVDEETDFDLNSDDEETVMITFTLNDKLDVDLEDLEEGDYVFYVRAIGEIDDGTYEGNDTCLSDSQTNSLTLDKDFVILNNIQLPELVQCNSEVQISANAWNIGSKDQDEVYVNVYNKELGIDQDVDLGDIDSYDSSDFNFNLQLPEDIKEKKYYLTLTVYDDSDDVYENDNNDEAVFIVPLNVQGSCVLAKASVTAVLESGGETGKLMVVKATIANTGDKTNTYTLNAVGYTEWASSVALDKSSLTLDAGKSEEVLLSFDVKKEVIGTNLFNLEVLSDNELVVSQPVQVEITKKKFGINTDFLAGNNKYIWGIGILNLILVIFIIIIAVKLSKKSRR
jgi:hypothetical protein